MNGLRNLGRRIGGAIRNRFGGGAGAGGRRRSQRKATEYVS